MLCIPCDCVVAIYQQPLSQCLALVLFMTYAFRCFYRSQVCGPTGKAGGGRTGLWADDKNTDVILERVCRIVCNRYRYFVTNYIICCTQAGLLFLKHSYRDKHTASRVDTNCWIRHHVIT